MLGVPLFIGLAGLCSVLAIGMGAIGRPRAADVLMRLFAQLMLSFFGVRIDARGREHLPPLPPGCLFLFNHQSHIDIPAIHRVIDRTLRFGAKIELFRIPVFGRAMRAVGVLPIPRDNRAEAMRVYREAVPRFADGWSFVLAAEGTRQSEPCIGPFKKGPFHFAIGAGVPIVPLVLKGTIDVLRKGSLAVNAGRFSRTVRVQILPPIQTAGMTGDDVPRLLEDVHARMAEAYSTL